MTETKTEAETVTDRVTEAGAVTDRDRVDGGTPPCYIVLVFGSAISEVMDFVFVFESYDIQFNFCFTVYLACRFVLGPRRIMFGVLLWFFGRRASIS